MVKKFFSHPKIRAIFWGLIGLLSAVSLWGYHDQDNSWNTSSGDVQNYLGVVGAWTADILLQLLGVMAFVFPVVCFAFALFLWRQKKWLKLRFLLIVVIFLWVDYFLGKIPLETTRSWFKADLGGYVGWFLNNLWTLPKGYWLILWGALAVVLFAWALMLPVKKMMTLFIKGFSFVGKSIWWVFHKMGIKFPAKFGTLFKKLQVHHQVEKIKKSVPKAKPKAVKNTPQTLAAKPVTGMQLPSTDLLAPVKES